jgi:hypothetical protein
MNVAELIELLSDCDPESRIVVSGYEGGVYDIDEVKRIPFFLNELALILSASDLPSLFNLENK